MEHKKNQGAANKEGERTMKKVILALLGAVVFGKMAPVILLALLIVGLVLIIQAAEGRHDN